MMRLWLSSACLTLVACMSAVGDEPVEIAPAYKRVHQDALRDVVQGRIDKARKDMEAFGEKYPRDAECRYMLTVIHAQLGEVEKAVEMMHRAIELGLPPQRFVSGTRTLLERLYETDAWKELHEKHRGDIAHGPMLGCATEDGIRIWVRTVGPARVQAVASRSKDLADAVRSDVVSTSEETDFTGKLSIRGLRPGTRYYYGVAASPDTKPREVHSFRIPVPAGKPSRFRVAFGGGAGFVPPNERVWNTVRSFEPDALLMLGDNVYIDQPDSPEIQHYTYYRRQSRPEWRSLVASTPVYAIWDDHDFGVDDCIYGPAVDEPAWKPEVWRVFRDNWINPGYGLDDRAGCYFDFQIGDVHFIMLDGRYFRGRAEHGVDPPSMLGPDQLGWLKDRLRQSEATFKVLCSPVPWTFEAKGNSPDTWNGFREERHDIFGFLDRHDTNGVVLMSADRHRSDLWRIRRDGTYDLYEFNSSRFTNQHVHPTMDRAEFSYNAKQSFGIVDFDTTADDPTVTYRIITIDGETVFTFNLNLSRLREP